MNNKILDIIRPSKVAGITVYYKTPTECDFTVCLMERKKGLLTILNKRCGIGFEELVEIIPKDYPVVLSFLGKVILNKEYEIVEGNVEPDQNMLNDQENEFYSFEHIGSKTKGVSICRKTVVDEIVNKLNDTKLSVVDVNIGPYLATALWDYNLISTSNPVTLKGGELNYNDQTLGFRFINHSKEKDDGNIRIGDEQLEPDYTLAYCYAFLWLVDNLPDTLTGDTPENITNGYEYKYWVNKSKFLMLGLVFVILIINFMVYESFRKKEAAISAELGMNTEVLSRRDSLENVLRAKEDYIKYIGENKTYYSYLLDEIAASVPGNVVLDEVELNPVIGKIQKNEPVNVEKKIIIRGMSRNSLILNQWNKRLSGMSWVASANVVNFIKTDDIEMGSFIIEIGLADD